MRSGSSTYVRPPPPRNPHGLGLTTGQPMGPREYAGGDLNKCSGEMQNALCEKRLVGNFREWCDIPLIRKPSFSTIDGCWLFDEIEGGRPFRGASRGYQRVPLHATPRRRPCHGR